MKKISCLIHVIMVLAHIAVDSTFTHKSTLDYVCVLSFKEVQYLQC
jgi:hypothetical protein